MDRTLRPGDPGDVGMSPERVARLRSRCSGWVEHGLTPSLQVLVARHGVVVLDEAWGKRGPEADAAPLDTDGIFAVGSMTKPITATAVMCLVEDGLLGLNRPVQEYVPEFVGEGKEQVMVHHLLTHTSGLRQEDIAAYLRERIEAGALPKPPPLPGVGPREALPGRCFEASLMAPLSMAPGTEMSYCTTGYLLLARIVERAAGQPVERFVQERVLDPLGMIATSYHGAPPERHQRVVRRDPDARFAIFDHPTVIAAGLTPGGGTSYSTARDVATLVQTYLNGGVHGGARILSPASVAEMTRNQIPGIGASWEGEFFPEAGWGYGWGIQGGKKGQRDGSLHSPATFSHGGIMMHFAWADPAYDLVGVYLSILPAEKKVQIAPGRHSQWCADLFANAVTASVVD